MSVTNVDIPAARLQNRPQVRSYGKERSTLLRDIKERVIVGILALCGAITISITLLILFILARETYGFFATGVTDVQGNVSRISLSDFLLDLKWNPLLGSEKHFGIWPLVVGTFQVTIVAMFVAIPLGLLVAIWLSEYAKPKVRSILKPILEIIAGVPTVVFGFFALTLVTPLLQLDFKMITTGVPSTDDPNPLNLGSSNVLAAGLTVGIMCIPIVTSLTEDALRAVPRALREGSYGLGASRLETSIKVILPAAFSGVVAACILAFARAVGETMIVAMAAGLEPPKLYEGVSNVVKINQPTQTMTGYMVQVFTGDTPRGTLEYQSVYAVGMTLFLITLGITILGAMLRKRFRQQYD